jgi:hypothetical protein
MLRVVALRRDPRIPVQVVLTLRLGVMHGRLASEIGKAMASSEALPAGALAAR